MRIGVQFVGIQPQKNVVRLNELPKISKTAESVEKHALQPEPKEVKKPGRPKKTEK